MENNYSEALYRLMVRTGYPSDFAALVSREMNTDYLSRRMLLYVNKVGLIPPEEFADEMLAILDDRDRLVKKHLNENAQMKINEMMLYGLDTED